MIQQLRENTSLKPINSFCKIDLSLSRPFMLHYFQLAQPLESILTMYHILSIRYPSDLFARIWKSVLKSVAKAKMAITFAEVVTRIWDPVFQQCCILLESVRSRTMKLRDVDQYFKQYEKNPKLICDHLLSLHSGIEACLNHGPVVSAWINSSVDFMVHYWILCEQAEAAKVVLHLKEILNITGDFDIVENVASKVTESMTDATLDKIDKKFIKATSFLKQISGKKLDCLQKFAQCESIIEWIRKETNG